MSSESENKEKLNAFFGKEYQSLKVYVRSKIKTSVNKDAEDIIQDVALKLFAGADRYSPINNVAGFVYYAIKNKIIDVMRSNSKSESATENQNELKLIEFVRNFTFTDVEWHGDQHEHDSTLSMRDQVVGYIPKIRVDILIDDSSVEALLKTVKSIKGAEGQGIYWITPLDNMGKL